MLIDVSRGFIRKVWSPSPAPKTPKKRYKINDLTASVAMVAKKRVPKHAAYAPLALSVASVTPDDAVFCVETNRQKVGWKANQQAKSEQHQWLRLNELARLLGHATRPATCIDRPCGRGKTTALIGSLKPDPKYVPLLDEVVDAVSPFPKLSWRAFKAFKPTVVNPRLTKWIRNCWIEPVISEAQGEPAVV